MTWAHVNRYWSDAEPIRQHVRMLAENGISIAKTGKLANIHPRTMAHLMYGSPSNSHRGKLPPARRVKRETANKLLAIKPSLDNVSAGSRSNVDSAITLRKLQAMMAMGWSLQAIGQMLDPPMDQSNIWKTTQKNVCRATTALAMRNLFDKYWDRRPPHRTTNEKALYYRALRHAESNGYVTAMAWDDIDDINERKPKAGPLFPRKFAKYRTDYAEEEIKFLLSLGEPLQSIATKLHISEKHLKERYLKPKEETMTHEVSSPFANQRVLVVAQTRLHGHETKEAEILIEDWWDKITGGSWQDAQGNPAALIYAMRSGLSSLPLDNEVLYGKDIYGMGHLIHVYEVKGKVLQESVVEQIQNDRYEAMEQAIREGLV